MLGFVVLGVDDLTTGLLELRGLRNRRNMEETFSTGKEFQTRIQTRIQTKVQSKTDLVVENGRTQHVRAD